MNSLPNTTNSRKAGSILAAALFATIVPFSLAAHSEVAGEGALNLADLQAGAQIECTTPDGRVELLKANEPSPNSAAVIRDEALSCPLQEGVTTFVIKLPSTALLDRFTFINENAAAEGELRISVSNYQLPAASPKWVEVDGSVIFSRKRLFNLSMLGVEARYVKLAFTVENGGRIGALGVYGGKALDRQVWQKAGNHQFGWIGNRQNVPEEEQNFDFNFATLHAKGRVVYFSSGQRPTAVRMIDDNNETAHAFGLKDDRPTAVVELAGNERIHRVTALYKAPVQGRFDVYLLEGFDKSAPNLDRAKPIASVTNEDGDGLAAVDFDPAGARYVAVRFTPGGEDGKTALASDDPFEIVEINAYGDMPLAMLDYMEAPDLYANHSAAPFPGEGGPDISTRLGVIAIPPVIPPVSP